MAAYSFEAFCADCRNNVTDGQAGRERVRQDMERLLAQPAFVAEHFAVDAEAGIKVLYTDEETGFQVLAHVYADGKQSPPHDHGHSWAVYGQAIGHTDMIVWRRLDSGTDAENAELEVDKTYRLDPPSAGTFEPGEIHSIKFGDGARFLRVTGTDLTKIATRRFDLETKTLLEDAGVSGVVR